MNDHTHKPQCYFSRLKVCVQSFSYSALLSTARSACRCPYQRSIFYTNQPRGAPSSHRLQDSWLRQFRPAITVDRSAEHRSSYSQYRTSFLRCSIIWHTVRSGQAHPTLVKYPKLTPTLATEPLNRLADSRLGKLYFFNLHVTGSTGPASGPLSFHTKIQKGLKLTLTRFAAAWLGRRRLNNRSHLIS